MDVKRFLAIAGRDADRIEREGAGWANPIAWTLRAAIASARTDLDGARRELTRAIDGFDRAEMPLYAAAARYRLGSLLAGSDGGELVLRSRAWMEAQQVVNPDRLAAMLTPGF